MLEINHIRIILHHHTHTLFRLFWHNTVDCPMQCSVHVHVNIAISLIGQHLDLLACSTVINLSLPIHKNESIHALSKCLHQLKDCLKSIMCNNFHSGQMHFGDFLLLYCVEYCRLIFHVFISSTLQQEGHW